MLSNERNNTWRKPRHVTVRKETCVRRSGYNITDWKSGWQRSWVFYKVIYITSFFIKYELYYFTGS
jgi:hypothetical protein